MMREYLSLAVQSIVNLASGSIGVAFSMYLIGNNPIGFAVVALLSIALIVGAIKMMSCCKLRSIIKGVASNH